MPTTEAPRPEDELDRALSDVLQYLALSAMVEGELNVVAAPMNKVIAALLVSEERQGGLSPYRAFLLQRIRSAGDGGHRE
jgi:hypothetical protein